MTTQAKIENALPKKYTEFSKIVQENYETGNVSYSCLNNIFIISSCEFSFLQNVKFQVTSDKKEMSKENTQLAIDYYASRVYPFIY